MTVYSLYTFYKTILNFKNNESTYQRQITCLVIIPKLKTASIYKITTKKNSKKAQHIIFGMKFIILSLR